ncbi:MAG: hypothetical protein VX899_09555 [Myxococcota bacterium]|nr:hypothetical protein [Myxococcota bacterium]
MTGFKNTLSLTVLGLGLLTAAPLANATGGDDLVVVLNAHNPTQTLSKGEVKSLYLGNTAFWNGVVPVQLVVRDDGSGASSAFYDVVGMSSQRYDSHWSAKQLLGPGCGPGLGQQRGPGRQHGPVPARRHRFHVGQ